ncbi:DUF1810 domain-containing protein [Paradesertivirga mongoliensis]|uniref:DUF1810 domain-containing protein n=1 Tax=Paradesertivirga mongoliensis TaxID=2100740 RepID=A0ABW4ZM52_9SPHI|nr:DUF1810 domain-containing protein [Pedobacter mongoliensis]
MLSNSLHRFYEAQKDVYQTALNEIRSGKKQTHWMWFIFPQLAGLGRTETSKFYAIRDLAEAELYLKDAVLGDRLIEISRALLDIKGKSAYEILGSPDDLKLRSSMTLFSLVKNCDPVFSQILQRYFSGKVDETTLRLLRKI